MSVVGGGGGKSEIDPKKLMILGIVGAFIGIYLTSLNWLIGAGAAFSFFAGLGAVVAIIWGADAVARVSTYGLGTGVPSIGNLSAGMGIVASLFGLAITQQLHVGVAGPILGFVTSSALGALVGYMANRIINMGIPVMVMATTEIAGAASLTMIALSTAIAGSYLFSDVMVHVIDNGFIALVFIGGGLAILHPYNACLGANESQSRTVMLSVVTGSIAMFLAGLASIGTIGLISAMPTIILAGILWLASFLKFYEYVKRDAYEVVGTGILPEVEEM